MPRNPKTSINDLLNHFAREEQSFLGTSFLAAALRGGKVQVRIGNIVCSMQIQPADFQGFGIFQPLSYNSAKLIREATLSERRQYLQLFPKVRLIVARREVQQWFGCAASFGDSRFRLDGLAPLALATEIQLFDCVTARFDGDNFWMESIDSRSDPAAASYLRQRLNEMKLPTELDRPGLTAEQRAAYELNYLDRLPPEPTPLPRPTGTRRRPDARRGISDPIWERLERNLSSAGARLIEYLERDDGFRVTYNINGRRYTSSVDGNLNVNSAGICLDGEDRKFDLNSLVGVLREGESSSQIYRM